MKRANEEEVLVSVDFPDDVWNQIVLFLGRIEEIMPIRTVSKKFRDIVERKTIGAISFLESPKLYKIPIDLLRECRGVKRMVLGEAPKNTVIDKVAISRMVGLETLKMVYFNGCCDFLHHLAKNLKNLYLTDNDNPIPDLTNFSSLEKLSLYTYDKTSSSLLHISIPISLRELKIIAFDSNINKYTISRLFNLTKLTILEGGKRNDDIGEAFFQMTQLSSLKLNFNSHKLDPKNMTPFASNLRKFHLSGNSGGAIDLDLLLEKMTNLTDLFLYQMKGSKLNGSSLIQMPFLKKLNLENTPLYNQYFIQLTTITTLRLCGNRNITDKSIQKLTQLESLTLLDNPGLSNPCLSGLDKLQKLLVSGCKRFVHPRMDKLHPSLIDIDYSSDEDDDDSDSIDDL